MAGLGPMGANLSALANAFLVMAGLVPAIHVSFVRRFGLTRLAYFAHHEDSWTAIQRETRLKHWPAPAKSISWRPENRGSEDLYPSRLS
jgi:hypothetical protein